MRERELAMWVVIACLAATVVVNAARTTKAAKRITVLAYESGAASDRDEDILDLISKNTALVGQLNEKDVLMIDTLGRLHKLRDLDRKNHALEHKGKR